MPAINHPSGHGFPVSRNTRILRVTSCPVCKMKYDTNNIDEAAYLALQGYHFTVTRTGPISALFSFETDEHFNEVRAKFWKGEVNVQLHRWLATRAALKNECAGQALSAKRVPSPSLVPAERETEAARNNGLCLLVP